MKLRNLILCLIIVLAIKSHSQTRQFSLGFSNNVTSYPIKGYPALFVTKFHPGLDVKLEQKLNTKEKNQWWCKAELSVFYHRLFQTAVKLNLGIAYHYYFKPRWSAFLGLEGGYLHSIYQYDNYRLNSDGVYVKSRNIAGRPQFNVGINWGGSFAWYKSDPQKMRLYIQFKTFTQGFFAGSYIPLLPYNHISIGITLAIKSKEKKDEK